MREMVGANLKPCPEHGEDARRTGRRGPGRSHHSRCWYRGRSPRSPVRAPVRATTPARTATTGRATPRRRRVSVPPRSYDGTTVVLGDLHTFARCLQPVDRDGRMVDEARPHGGRHGDEVERGTPGSRRSPATPGVDPSSGASGPARGDDHDRRFVALVVGDNARAVSRRFDGAHRCAPNAPCRRAARTDRSARSIRARP